MSPQFPLPRQLGLISIVHLVVACVSPDPCGNSSCCQNAALKSMAHTVTAKRIHHTGSVTVRYVSPGQSIVSETTGHQTVRPCNVLRQRVLLDEETPIRPPAFHLNTAPVPIFKDPEVQHGPSRPRLRILDTKFVH